MAGGRGGAAGAGAGPLGAGSFRGGGRGGAFGGGELSDGLAMGHPGWLVRSSMRIRLEKLD